MQYQFSSHLWPMDFLVLLFCLIPCINQSLKSAKSHRILSWWILHLESSVLSFSFSVSFSSILFAGSSSIFLIVLFVMNTQVLLLQNTDPWLHQIIVLWLPLIVKLLSVAESLNPTTDPQSHQQTNLESSSRKEAVFWPLQREEFRFHFQRNRFWNYVNSVTRRMHKTNIIYFWMFTWSVVMDFKLDL